MLLPLTLPASKPDGEPEDLGVGSDARRCHGNMRSCGVASLPQCCRGSSWTDVKVAFGSWGNSSRVGWSLEPTSRPRKHGPSKEIVRIFQSGFFTIWFF